MSEPKRYHLWAGLDVHAFAKCEAVLKYCVEDEGVWVMYEDYAALQAKVERLTKAGIAMGMALPDTDEANAAYRSFERVVQS